MAEYNQPWHTETEFENFSRLLIGSTSTDHMTADTWSECRSAAEFEVISHITDALSPNRLMLARVPGELVPQYTPILSNTASQTFTLTVPDVVSTPSSDKPVVWRNLAGPWERRWEDMDLYRMTEDNGYTMSGNDITLTSPSKGDRYTVEYKHTLTPIPGLLKSLSLLGTVERCLINKFGIDHSRVEMWARQFGSNKNRQIKMLLEGSLQIPEFASVELYSDWSEDPKSVTVVDIRRN